MEESCMGRARMARLLMACVVGLVLTLGAMAGRVAAEEGSEGSSQAYESMQMATESVSETVYKAYNSTKHECYATIHEAVADAEANDEIVVVAGEHKLTSTITINKPIVLSGATQGHSLLEIDVNTGKSGIAIMPGADGTRIQGLEIVKTDKPVPAGNQELVYIQANNVTITGNKLHGQYEMGENEVARAMVVAAGVTGLEISDNEIFALRQPAYFSGTSGTVKNNYVYGTRGWVVEQGDWNFQGNTWGTGSLSNYVDIAILDNEGGHHYQDIVALSKANNGAVVEDQRVTPAVLSVVHVDAGAVSGGDGTPTKPYTSMSEGVARVVQGGTVHVAEGMYLASGDYIDSIALSKPLRLLGPNAGINPNKSTRNAEAVLKGTISLDTANGAEVVIDGLMFLDDQLGRDHISVYLKGSGDYEIKNCVFERDTGATNDQLEPEKGHMIRAIHIGPASCSAVIENNLFTGSDTNIYRNSSWSSAIWSDSVTSEDGVVIQNNVFNTNRTALNLDNRVDNIEVTGNRFVKNGTHISFGGSPVLLEEYDGIYKNKFSFAGAVFNLSDVDPNFRLDAKDNEYDVSALDSVDNAKIPAEMELDELLILESTMYHKGKDGRQGLVSVVDGQLFVTETSGTIQQALKVAKSGDTILVGPGEYAENLTIDKSVSLYGVQSGIDARNREGKAESRITGSEKVLEIRASEVTIDGFTLDSAGWDGRVSPQADNITIMNNIIKRTIYVATDISDLKITQNWFAETGGGASAFNSERSITRLQIENNLFTDIPYSAVILGGSVTYENALIADNDIYRCGYQAINLSGEQSNLSVKGNYIENAYLAVGSVGDPDRGGIRIYGSAFTGPVNITNNTVVDSYNGFAVRNGENIEGKEINVTHNKFLENLNAGVYHGGTGTLNAILNYWGAPTGPTVDGEGRDHVNCVPWYVDANMTTQSDQLALTCQIDGNGSVTLKLGDNEYKHDEDVLWNYGDEVQLVATPGSGWRFSKWEGDIGEAKATARKITILMDDNKSVAAVFTKISVIPDPGSGTGGPSGPVEPPVIAPSVTETVEAEVGGTVELEDGSAAVELPPNAVSEEVTVTLAPVTEVTQPTAGMVMIAGKVFEITAETEDGELVTQFSEPITLTFKLTQEELEEAEIELEDLRVFYWDEKAGAWIALPTRVDPETGTVTAVTDHFTVFAVMAKPDMPALSDILGHWGEKDILRLVSLGAVGGYEDGTFRPEAGITRQEFAKMVVLAAGLEPDAEPELAFADTDEIAEWARGYVSAAVKAGIITGVGDNRFAPADPVTRAQAATMIMRSLGEMETSLELTFADAETIPEWAQAAILGAVEKGIITGFEDNTFRPDLNATRAQAAKMLSRLTVVRFED
jgi:hypothetical protein